MINRFHILNAIFVAMFPLVASGYPVSMLSIGGDDSLPGIVGEYSTQSSFSWMSNRFPANTSGHSWTLGPGTDGGIVFGQSQDVGAMTGVRPMFNIPTAIYSINAGLGISQDGTIDMANVRMWHGGEIINIGDAQGYSSLIPRVADLGLLGALENGWTLDQQSGIYHLLYHTVGTCADCELTVHLTGMAAVPLPSSIWLMLSGIAILIRKRGVHR